YPRILTGTEITSLAELTGCVRSAAGDAVDGEFSGGLPSGNGAAGGDFVSTFAIVPDPPSVVEEASGGGNRGCGALGIEVFIPLGILSLLKRRRRASGPSI
ncbi:MAG TPA: hypothetical protein VK661_04485, partial [Planctomycetota bacterium]|nr:hypothetical protein [Planctomycetota bacterium]